MQKEFTPWVVSFWCSKSSNFLSLLGVYMGCQNNTAVAVSRFKPIQCIACRFLRWLYVWRVDPLLSWGSFGKSDFQEKHFNNQLHAIPIVNWFLKVLPMPIPLYSMWQVYQTCSLGCCGHRRAVKKKKKKKRKKKKKKNLFLYSMHVCIYTYNFCFTNTNAYSNKN